MGSQTAPVAIATSRPTTAAGVRCSRWRYPCLVLSISLTFDCVAVQRPPIKFMIVRKPDPVETAPSDEQDPDDSDDIPLATLAKRKRAAKDQDAPDTSAKRHQGGSAPTRATAITAAGATAAVATALEAHGRASSVPQNITVNLLVPVGTTPGTLEMTAGIFRTVHKSVSKFLEGGCAVE